VGFGWMRTTRRCISFAPFEIGKLRGLIRTFPKTHQNHRPPLPLALAAPFPSLFSPLHNKHTLPSPRQNNHTLDNTSTLSSSSHSLYWPLQIPSSSDLLPIFSVIVKRKVRHFSLSAGFQSPPSLSAAREYTTRRIPGFSRRE
jgi:hypothetical protein